MTILETIFSIVSCAVYIVTVISMLSYGRRLYKSTTVIAVIWSYYAFSHSQTYMALWLPFVAVAVVRLVVEVVAWGTAPRHN
jgi:hypothetical protein